MSTTPTKAADRAARRSQARADRAKGPGFAVNTAFGIGALSSGVVTQSLSGLVMIFYNQVIGMSPAAVGLALMISLISDAFWDPAIGIWSDGTRSRWGRRLPFMYAAIIPSGLTFWLLWAPPAALPEAAHFAYLLVTLMAVRFTISLHEIPSTALAPEMAPDYDARTGLLAGRYFYGVLGFVIASLLAFQGFLSDRAGGVTHLPGYAAYGAAGGVIISVTLLISTFGTRRQAMGSTGEVATPLRPRALAAHIWGAFTNRNFAAIMIAALFAGMASGISTALTLYFNLYFWGLSTNDLSLLVLAGLVASIIGVFIAPALSRRFGKKPVVLTVFSISFFFSVLPITLRLLGVLPGNNWSGLVPFLFVETLIAATLGLIGLIVVTSMLADVVEDNAAKTGQRSEGLFFAANSVLSKSVTGVGTFVSGLMLTFVSFPKNAVPGAVGPEIMHKLAYVYLPTTVVLSIASLVFLSFYRIDRAAHDENLSRARALQRARTAQDDHLPTPS
jgi:GPH family glycoside/pentoside/hexuronide:cation symporter